MPVHTTRSAYSDGIRSAAAASVVRAFMPHTQTVEIVEAGARLDRVPGTDLFEWVGDAPIRYRIVTACGA